MLYGRESRVRRERVQARRCPRRGRKSGRGLLRPTDPLVIGALLSAVATPAAGQATVDFRNDSNLLVGYVVNAPSQLLGLGVGAMIPVFGGLGLYADAKLTLDSPARDALLSLTPREAEDLGDVFFARESAWTTLNLAVLKGISPELAVYVGGGPSWQTMYAQYVDDTGERGDRGRYWVEEEGQPVLHANVLGGALFRLGRRISFQFGAERAPGGFTAGVHVLLW